MGIKVKIINGVKVSKDRMQAVETEARVYSGSTGEQISFRVLGEDQAIRVNTKDIIKLIEAARKEREK